MTAGAREITQPEFLSDVHRAYLNEHAVSSWVIATAGIHSAGDDIVFPWQDNGLRTEQRRTWPEPEEGLPPGVQKYRWETGESNHLAGWRPLDENSAPDAPVIIAEGTKQSLAVASYAPAGYAVYGMPGCDIGLAARLQRAALNRFAGHPVIIMLDADAAENLNVYEAGEKLAELLNLEGATAVTFTRLPAQGTDGIDDFLGLVQPEERRAEVLAKLLASGGPKPAERRPSHRKVGDQLPDTGGRPLVVVNKDRRDVIQEILWHMKQRWSEQLFCYGGVLTRLRGTETEPLEPGAFLRWMSETAATFRYRPPSAGAAGSYEASWPEPQTVAAMLASGDEFAPLDRVSRMPFIRPDGTVCFKNGYDWDPATGAGTQAMLVAGNSGMDRLGQHGELDNPTREDASAAAQFLLGDWLGDDPAAGTRGMPWRDDASRANALALILTPFIRGIVPLVPLAVISGLQQGVGKNLLADCISLMIAGENIQPLQWIPDDDDEIRKQITSAFRGGSSLVCFDEAHVIGGTALTRAITATTYADRILGVSTMASYPNRVTWLALGNQVQPRDDMARRVYYVELYPEGRDPQNRPESVFHNPDLRGWTLGNRPELVTAALTMIRAWYTAGQPAFPHGFLMGSFEAWDKMMSGILGWAGVPGFLGNLLGRRAELDTTAGYWTEHLGWLRARFGDGPFTALDVKLAAIASAGAWDAPPYLDEPDTRGFTRNLGAAYGRNQDRYFGPYQMLKAGTGHGTKVLWLVRDHGNGNRGGTGGSTLPDLGGMDGMDQMSRPSGEQGVVSGTLPELGRYDQLTTTTPSVSWENGVRDGLDGSDGSPTLMPHARTPAHAHVRAHEGGQNDLSRPSHPSGPVLGFDLETGEAGKLFTYTPHDETGFVRLAGVTGPSGANMITGVPQLLAMLNVAGRAYGHNVLGFDGLALARWAGADWDWFCDRAVDTELIARQAYPPRSRESGTSADKLGLDAVAALLGLPGKTDELSRLARQHGGYDLIPLDDPEYLAYLGGDLDATRGVAGQLLRHYDEDAYLPREHELARIAGHMALNGLAVDIPLLEQRYEAGEQRRRDALQALHDGWGLPLGRTVLRGRGGKRHEETEGFTAPLATGEGRAWLAAQWERYQIPAPPLTAKGLLAIGSDELAVIARDPDCPPDLRAMLALMNIVTTTRSVYQTAKAWLCPDGKVHPKISFRQASGRWSVTDPGLTVFGKHEGRHVERDIFTASPGRVLMSFDLEQVDMRAIAGHSQDRAYMALFEPGRDAHSEIAARVFGEAPRDAKGRHPMRQPAKARGHGWNYGMGPDRMIRDGVDPDMAYGFDNGMKAAFPVLCDWREGIRAIAAAGGILDNGFGRRMRADPRHAHTVAPALMGQGGARDIMGECLLRTDPALRRYMVLQVHDEVILDIDAADAEEAAAEVRRAMTWTWRDVPILCDQAGPGQSWGELSADK
jgi:hypothetical protein